MALDFENTLEAENQLNLWYKLENNAPITLADMPDILRLRWIYFRDNWEFVREKYVEAVSSYSDPDGLKSECRRYEWPEQPMPMFKIRSTYL